MSQKPSHFGPSGDARMVNVADKPVTARAAVASGCLSMMSETADIIRAGSAEKGDVLGIARVAAIQATKLTQQLIPLCHAIPVESVSVQFDWPDPNRLRCHVEVKTTAKTGVEMEALAAASVACLTVYDMVKSIDREMTIGPIQLEKKSGGRSGDFHRSESDSNG